jgi:putative tricarboxylic transport membrane protein
MIMIEQPIFVYSIVAMLFFGNIGFILRRMNYPMAPVVPGNILGDLMDKNLRRGLTLSDGDLTPFFTRPISMVFWIVIVLTIIFSIGHAPRGITALGRRIWSTMQSSEIC